MTFIVVVHVDDVEAARDLNGLLTEATAQGHNVGRVVGMYAWPTPAELTCAGFCSDGKTNPWSFGRRGMTCGVCGGRHVDTKKRVAGALRQYLGRNLLKNAPVPFRNPDA